MVVSCYAGRASYAGEHPTLDAHLRWRASYAERLAYLLAKSVSAIYVPLFHRRVPRHFVIMLVVCLPLTLQFELLKKFVIIDNVLL